LILHKDVDVQPNPGEVSDIHWIRKENFEDQIKSLDAPLTPWFNMFYKSGRLIPWWENLHQLKKCEDHKIIHKLN
jgi:isopentenyl-diphosphate Delta-isomerase